MDTRTKIVPAAKAAEIAARGATVVSGYFDPLLPVHAGRLGQLKRAGAPLLVLISDPEAPVLPARARAELVAGLAAVDYVAESGAGVSPHIRLESEHRRQFDDLIEHLHARQRAGS